MRLLLKGGNVFIDGVFVKKDILVCDRTISVITDRYCNNDFEKAITCDGFFVCPGFNDVHVHLREPGLSYKETIASGTEAAACGGYTAVCAMPNVVPVPSSAEGLSSQEKIIASDSVITVLPYGSITENQNGRGDLSAMDEIADRVVSFSDDGVAVSDEGLMEKAMLKAKALGKIITAHCENTEYEPADSRSEWTDVEKNIELAKKTGAKLHICHVSSAESVDLIRRAKAKGADITCETAPHYLALCNEETDDHGRFKMNPPIRGRDDQLALIQGVIDGTVDMIATDHAPHSFEEKNRGFKESLNGVSGLESAFPVINTVLCENGYITREKMIQLMSENPALRFGFKGGIIREGEDADITVLDMEREHIIDEKSFKSRGKSCPFHGMKVKGMVMMTIHKGEIVYER